MAYKINLTEQELNILNTKIYKENLRKRLMSIYSYIIKHSLKNAFTISFTNLLRMYNRNHQKISLTTLKNYINKLKDLKLINITNILISGYEINSYTTMRQANLSTILSDKLTNENSDKIIETTSFEDDSKKHKYLNNKTNTKELELNNNNEPIDKNLGFDYDHYIDSIQKVSDENIVISKAKKLFKILNVRSNWIKETVIANLLRYAKNITLKHMDKYICTTISRVREEYYRNYDNYVQPKNCAEKKLRFCDYEQRTYDYDKLERKLLGWDCN